MIDKIDGFEINLNEKSERIININITDEILNKLIFPLNKFDITALEYKPFTRFTLAKSLDDLSDNKLSKLLNKIISDRNTGCFIIKPKKLTSKIDESFFNKIMIRAFFCICCAKCESFFLLYLQALLDVLYM